MSYFDYMLQGEPVEMLPWLYLGNGPCVTLITRCREERREACQGQAKEKDGPEDGGESRNSKCGHYDWQRERVG